MYRLIIAQKAYSSWSLRGWLLLDAFGIPFKETMIRMYQPDFAAAMNDKSPAQTVPILEWVEAGKTRCVWESLAIAETLAERHPDAGIWPADPANRSVARIIASEMHAGFTVLRTDCPMNLHRSGKPKENPSDALLANVARAGKLWIWALQETGGPWLGGPNFSAADVFMAPLATRLVSYDLLDETTEPYASRLLAHSSVQRWVSDAEADPERIAWYDAH
ncbi:MAG: glutathione S-transferase N-terminal domain-containing protein [Pseudomonadota bacterium]